MDRPDIGRQELGILQPIDHRSVWQDEAADFTPWLRDHIDLLGAQVGIRFEAVASEEPVGRYTADLWAQEEAPTRRSIVIENQLTDSDHDHLGKLLTYGAGLDAALLVWIAPHFRVEHLDALRWLNEKSGEHHHYFAVQLEVFRIGESQPAPFFRVLVQPRDWVRTSEQRPREHSPRMKAYHDFFLRLLNSLKQHPPLITQMTQVGYQSWLAVPAGRTGFSFSCAFTRGERFRVELYIDAGEVSKNKKAFETLESQREAIEREVGAELAWERLDDARASRVACYTGGSIDYASERLQELSDWAIKHILVFRDAFAKRIKQL